jgi:hypothetical protein
MQQWLKMSYSRKKTFLESLARDSNEIVRSAGTPPNAEIATLKAEIEASR